MFEFQIKDLRQYINHLDEKIARYQKQGKNTDRLQGDKSHAILTILELEQYQTMQGKEIGS